VKGKGLFDQMRSGVRSEEEIAIDALFPVRDKFKMLQMINEQQPRAIMPWSVLGLLRVLYGSKVLRIVQEEHNLNKIAQERKGRLELSEVVVGVRKAMKDKDDD